MKKSVLPILLTVIFALALAFLPAGRNTVRAADNTIYRNNILNVVVSSDDGSCNFRSGPGTGYGIIQPIYNGTVLRITGVSRNSQDGYVWGQTTYNGTSGWISLRLTIVNDVENSSRANYDVTVTMPDYIVLREGPGAEFDALYWPYEGQVLRITQTVANSFDGRPWGKTTINGLSGWVSLDWTMRNDSWTYNQAQDVTFYNNIYTAVVSASDYHLNLRTGPGISYPIITPIYNGNSLRVTAALDNSQDGLVWGYTTYNGMSGWVSMSQTTITNMENASYAAYYVSVENVSNICLRKGPGAEYDELVSYIPYDTSLYITQTVINSFDGRPWGKTYYNGMEGWVSLNWTYRGPGM